MSTDRRRPSDRTYRNVQRFFAGAFRLLGLRITVRGAEHLPTTGPAVIASNHTGFLDFTFIGYAARERGRLVRFMSKLSVFENWLSGWLMRAMRHIPVDRWSGAIAYRRARTLLDEGEIVGVFPEATISRSWLIKGLKPGAAGLALSRSVPLVPAVVWGSHRILTVDGHRSLRRGKAVTILLGEPLHAADGETHRRTHRTPAHRDVRAAERGDPLLPGRAEVGRRPMVAAARPWRHRASTGRRRSPRSRGPRPHQPAG